MLALRLGELAQLLYKLAIARDVLLCLAAIQLILLILNNDGVGNKMKDTFSHVPVGMTNELDRLSSKQARIIVLYEQAATPKHSLPYDYFAI
jgi:hypothetical protein